MTPALSIWLDLCRVLAALVVYVGHSFLLNVAPPEVSATWMRSADDAVTAFFVISGLVIAHTTRNHHDDPGRYALARLSRVYSVAIPAVLFAWAVDLLGMRFDSSLYFPDWQYPRAWLHMVFHWLFLGETWFGAVQPFSMAPYWSLGYEVWYYVLFGVAVFLRGPWRWLAVVLVLAAMGPRIALLLPVWCLGVWLQRWVGGVRLGKHGARLLMGLAVVAYTVFLTSGWRSATDQASKQLYAAISSVTPIPFDPGSTVHVLSDYVMALCFMAFVVGCARCEWDLSGRLASLIRWLAGFTFTFYLIHYTLLVFARALGVLQPGWTGYALLLGGVLLCTWLLAQLGEQRRHLYRRAMLRLWRARPWGRPPATPREEI